MAAEHPDSQVPWSWLSRIRGRQGCEQLIALLTVLNVADIITTHAVLRRGGTETNPLMRSIVDNTTHASVIKLLILCAVAALISRTEVSGRIVWTLATVTALYCGVVTWNLAVLAMG